MIYDYYEVLFISRVHFHIHFNLKNRMLMLMGSSIFKEISIAITLARHRGPHYGKYRVNTWETVTSRKLYFMDGIK